MTTVTSNNMDNKAMKHTYREQSYMHLTKMTSWHSKSCFFLQMKHLFDWVFNLISCWRLITVINLYLKFFVLIISFVLMFLIPVQSGENLEITLRNYNEITGSIHFANKLTECISIFQMYLFTHGSSLGSNLIKYKWTLFGARIRATTYGNCIGNWSFLNKD